MKEKHKKFLDVLWDEQIKRNEEWFNEMEKSGEMDKILNKIKPKKDRIKYDSCPACEG